MFPIFENIFYLSISSFLYSHPLNYRNTNKNWPPGKEWKSCIAQNHPVKIDWNNDRPLKIFLECLSRRIRKNLFRMTRQDVKLSMQIATGHLFSMRITQRPVCRKQNWITFQATECNAPFVLSARHATDLHIKKAIKALQNKTTS